MSISYIRAKVDQIDERLDSIDKNLALNTRLLDDHIRRTNILEAEIARNSRFIETRKTVEKIIIWVLGVGVTLVAAILGTMRG